MFRQLSQRGHGQEEQCADDCNRTKQQTAECEGMLETRPLEKVSTFRRASRQGRSFSTLESSRSLTPLHCNFLKEASRRLDRLFA